MSEELVSESAAPGFTRLGGPAATVVADLGPLADLVGTWVGASGQELIAVPAPKGFTLINRPYIEILTFTPIGAPVPNRGGPVGVQHINGVLYETRISDAKTNEPLHVENGMWLFTGATSEGPPIARLATIPHGDSVLALGTAATTPGGPTFPHQASARPDGRPPHELLAYLLAYDRWGLHASDYNAPLKSAIAGLHIVTTTTLSVTTEGGGSIANIPFVDAHAAATRFVSTFWIETVRRDNGAEYQQLQYSQQTTLEFLQKEGAPEGTLVKWPHTNTATLTKQ